jgi:hypothetical protein
MITWVGEGVIRPWAVSPEAAWEQRDSSDISSTTMAIKMAKISTNRPFFIFIRKYLHPWHFLPLYCLFPQGASRLKA